ncbi:MAG: DUF4428 domain-containing protein [Blautia sp.]|nr:DUF4428 domain-containing protein [Blautia sp.]
MGLFDKKYCDVCGEKIGLFGNKKLEDANLCKNCEKKLSPWFTGRRHTSLEEIKEQLAYREENLQEVKNFHTTQVLGKRTRVILDEDAGKFMVTSSHNLEEANPDVLSFSQVTGVDISVDENRSELYRKDSEGKNVSYNPPRYEYTYRFQALIRVNHPYFDEMKFPLNDSSIEITPPYTGGPDSRLPHPEMNVEYQEYKELGQEIKEALLGNKKAMKEAEAASNAPKKTVECPFCHAATIPDANGCCEYCGSVIQ